ncbi:MAG: SurA N-terminal domain-containing protein [Woeseiaceae bacterium]|nr:SurA N-terminal domain-containing protein [Woeseiaceae bacterium]
MLQNIREKFTGWIAISILALIGVTFIFVGGANFAFIGSNFAAKVDGVEIGLVQFESAYQDQVQQNPTLATMGADIRAQVRLSILEQLIQQRVIDNYLVEAGFRISDQFVTDLIQRTPDFQVDGRFDMDTYLELLAANGYDPADFERAQRVTLRRQQLQRAIGASTVVTPSAYRRYLNLAAEQRIVSLATIDPAVVADEINITPEMVTAYYDDNPTLYQVPESADIEYVEVSRADVARQVSVTEDELADHYEYNKDRYLQDEQRQARHILFLFNDDEDAAEVRANEILARVTAGESFEELAREFSDDGGTAEQGGDLGVLTQTQLPDSLGGAIFSMNEGDIEGPVKTDFGFHIVRLDRIFERGPLPLDQVRGELTTELQDQEAEDLFRELERKLSDALFDATDIRALAEAVGAEVKSAAGFTRNGGDPLGTSPDIVAAVFDETVLSGAQLSEIIEIDAGRSAVVSVTRHNLAARQSLDDVREQVESAIRNQQAETLMASKADDMIEALEAGAEFAGAAAQVGASAGDPVLLSRDADASTTDQFVSVAIFTAVKPTQDNPTRGSTRNGVGGYTVYSVEAVIPGRPETIPLEQRDAGKMQLTDQTGLGDFVAFVQALREDAEVIINEDALAANESF